jgi:predicted permease
MPPPLAVWLLTARLREEWRDYVLGDLEEEFSQRAARSPAAARRWYWSQALRGLISRLPVRHHNIGASPAPRGPRMSSLFADLKLAARTLRRSPSFTIAAASVMALGIAANTAMFGLVNTVLLRPLPFKDPARLVRLFHIPPQKTFPGIPRFPLSPANFYDWQKSARSFDAMALYAFRPFTLTGVGNPSAALAAAMGPGFFDIVGTPPLIGRTFRDADDAPGGPKIVIVSEGFWRGKLGADPGVLSRTLVLGGEPHQIVGVMPAAFSAKAWGATSVDLWVPLAHTPEKRLVRDNHNEQAIARLKPGVTLAEAQAELSGIAARLEAAYPQENAGWGAVIVPLNELIVSDIRTTLMLLVVAVGLLLLIACANVGNLIFTRAIGRQKEIAVRSALGAARSRVFQQLIVESMLVAFVGGVIGLAVSYGVLAAGKTMLADQLPRADELSLDWRVVLFAIGVSALTGLIAGGIPAFRASRTNLNENLKESGRHDSTAAGLRTRRVLIVAEIALSLMLLMGAGIMMRSLLALRHADAGINASNVLTMRVALPAAKYKEPERRSAFFDQTLDEIRALPGVEAAGGIDDLPTQNGSVQPLVPAGSAVQLPKDQPTVEVRTITPGYLRAMAIPVLAGRDVAAGDIDVMLVSESAAKLLWKNASPVGTRASFPLMSTPDKPFTREIIGVVGDVKQGELSEAAQPTVYHYTKVREWSSLALVVRTKVPPMSIAKAAAGVVLARDPDQPVEEIKTMEAVLDDQLASRRFSARLLGLFAGLAMALASIGIYTVLGYIVRGRSREISIRSALGARTADVVRMVVAEGMTPALIGIGLGIAGSFATSTLLERMVFGISPSDPWTMAAVAAGLALVALVASVVPALRAARVDPASVLRS